MKRRDVLKGTGLLAAGAVLGAAGGATLPFFQNVDVTANLNGNSVPTPGNNLDLKLNNNERDYRWNKTRELLKGKGLKAVIVASTSFGQMPAFATLLANSLFMKAGAVVLPLEGEPLSYGNMVAPFDGSWLKPEPMFGESATNDFLNYAMTQLNLSAEKIGTVGIGQTQFGYNEFYNDGFMGHYAFEQLQTEHPQAQFIDITAEFAEMIIVKSEEDIAIHKQAALIGEGLHQYLVENVKEGMSDRELKAMIDYYLAINGAQGDVKALFMMPGIIKKGALINAEHGIKYNGGYAQCTICLSVGEPNAKAQKMHDIAKASLAKAQELLVPGNTFGQVVEATDKIVKDAGFWHMFPQVHGLSPIALVGTVGNNPDSYQPTRGADIVIKEGMIFSLENGAIAGDMPLNQVKIGGTGVVTHNGFKLFNSIGTEMRVV